MSSGRQCGTDCGPRDGRLHRPFHGGLMRVTVAIVLCTERSCCGPVTDGSVIVGAYQALDPDVN